MTVLLFVMTFGGLGDRVVFFGACPIGIRFFLIYDDDDVHLCTKGVSNINCSISQLSKYF